MMPEANPTRTCRKCGQTKSINDLTKTSKGKPTRECKTCAYARTHSWAVKNRERSRAIKSRYVERHPDRHAASQQKYYEANRSDVIRRTAEGKVARGDEINARYREQYREDPTPFNARNARREERDLAVDGLFTVKDEQAMFIAQDGKCAACKVDISDGRFDADHIMPVLLGGSHWPANRQLLCRTCNHRKGTKTPEQWAIFVRKWGSHPL